MKQHKHKRLEIKKEGNKSTNNTLTGLSGSFLMRFLDQTKKGIKKLNHILSKPIIRTIKLYQYTLSPDKGLPSFRLRGRICHHKPHCSQYGIEVLQKYGFYPGIVYMIDRITSCTGASNIKQDPSSYKVVFFSSAPIGIPFLQKLRSDPRYELVGVVTTPDKPAGRGMKIKPNHIKTEAQKLYNSRIEGNKSSTEDLFIQTPASLRHSSKKYSKEAQEFTNRLKTKDPDFLVVIAYGKIIPQHILDIPRVAPINVHGSILPEYRGASPIQSVFLDGKKESGITIMKMDAGLDTGDILAIKKTKLHFDRTAMDLIKRMQAIGPNFLNKTMRDYAKGHIDPEKQNDEKATHCGKLEKDQAKIEPFSDSLEKVYNIYRGCILWPKAHFFLDEKRPNHEGKRIIIEQLEIDESIYNHKKDKPLRKITNGQLETNKAILLLILKPEGKKALKREEFTKGYHFTKNS